MGYHFYVMGLQDPTTPPLIFNVLVGNSDSHAKNYSILIGAGGTAKLAPLYDVMCAVVYRNVDQSLPQAIGKRTNPNELHGDDWRMLAGASGLSAAATLARVRELAQRVSANTAEAVARVNAMPAGGHEVLKRAEHAIGKLCERILRQL
ncbi:MAG: HipA domain-containing protein [Oxalobacteraceae bacterium]|nr:MAG: HipA domain-containing protein [Oxalobacteraceae bacterium]